MESSSTFNGRTRLSDLCIDEFERNVLKVLRHFFSDSTEHGQKAWLRFYSLAVEIWDERIGLPVAHQLAKLSFALEASRKDQLSFTDPFSLETRLYVTEDERDLIQMLHYMRRDQTGPARDAVSRITGGRMDPDLIRAALSFSRRFAKGCEMQSDPCGPNLRLVS